MRPIVGIFSAALLVLITSAASTSRGFDRMASRDDASGTNLCANAEIHVSSEQNGFPGTNAVDGNRHSEWAGNGAHPWITLTWKEPVKIGRLVLRDRTDPKSKAQGGKILFSDGGTLDVDDIPPGGEPREVRFAPKTVRWLRFDLFTAIGEHPGLAEIEAYSDGGDIAKPKPVDNPPPGTCVVVMGDDPRITAVDGVREGGWNGAMWCPFSGTSVKLIGNTGPASGMADVFVDGIRQRTADWYSEKPAADVTVFAADNLPDGKHLLGVLTRGAKRAEAKGAAIHWSRIEYVAGSHPEEFVASPRKQFDPNAPLWLDSRGEPIQGHMGGILFHEGKYYWLGSDWRGKPLPGFPFDWRKNPGFAVYSSSDLMNWTYHGNSCGPASEPNHPLYNYVHVAARVRPLFAKRTGKFIAFFQVVAGNTFGNVLTSEMNATAIAVADKPEGPYRWHGILQCNGAPVQGSDTAVFTDDDGKQYLISAFSDSAWNVSDCLYELAPDCLSAVKCKRLGTGGEAPAIFKQQGVYYLLHSQLTGLNANENFYHTATNLWGPWQAKGRIAQGDHSDATFVTQTMDVVPVANKPGAFIWIGDSVRNNTLPTTRTVWLPVTIKRPGEMELRWRDSWDWSVFGEKK